MPKAKKKLEVAITKEIVLTATPPAQPLTVKITAKVTPFQALINLMLYIFDNPKTDFEKQLSEWFTNEMSKHADVTTALEELKLRGYVDDQYAITAYGRKLALTSTSPTPNLQRLADSGFSTAVAMMFASHKSLVEKHGILENGIKPGKDDRMCESVLGVSDDLYEALKKGGFVGK